MAQTNRATLLSMFSLILSLTNSDYAFDVLVSASKITYLGSPGDV